jgi:hypothetical protein
VTAGIVETPAPGEVRGKKEEEKPEKPNQIFGLFSLFALFHF